jgi:hypothetical protein
MKFRKVIANPTDTPTEFIKYLTDNNLKAKFEAQFGADDLTDIYSQVYGILDEFEDELKGVETDEELNEFTDYEEETNSYSYEPGAFAHMAGRYDELFVKYVDELEELLKSYSDKVLDADAIEDIINVIYIPFARFVE